MGQALVWNVPYLPNPFFTGREKLLDLLHQKLILGEKRDATAATIATLTQPQAIKGLGGIGKTQIAVEYAYRHRDWYSITLWINAATEETLFTSFAAIAEILPSFPAKDEIDQRKLIEKIKCWLEQCEQRWLLIFDNADDISLVRGFLPQGGKGSILLTTRMSAVGSIGVPIEVEKMGFMEGIHLLLRRAQRFDDALDEEINEAGNIVIALDAFPLALDQAGAYIEETRCGFVSYLQMYQTHRKELLMRRGMTTNYPDSVATTWSLSFQKIEQANPAAAEFLRLCAFLAPDKIPEDLIRDGAAQWSQPLQQAASDAFAFNQMMADLLKFSLIQRVAEAQTISIHRLVQAVQMDMMEPDVQYQWAARVIRAVNTVFPVHSQDITTWPQCHRYLDQAQVCNILIEQYTLPLVAAANLLNRTGLYLHALALYTIAEPLLLRALEIQELQLGPEHPDTATYLNNLAGLYQSQSRYTEAEPLFKRALKIREMQLEPEHSAVANSLNNLAHLSLSQRRYTEAEPLFQRALEICEQHCGPEHPDTAICLNNLAKLYEDQEMYTEAEPLFQRALEIYEHHRPKHPETAFFLSNLANLYKKQEKYTEAEKLFQRALEIREMQLEPERPHVADSLTDLALLYKDQEKYAEAEPLFKRALDLREMQLEAKPLDVANSLTGLALLYKDQEKYAEAEPLFQHALKMCEQHYGLLHINTATSLKNLALLYKDQEKYAEAEPLFQRALKIYEQHYSSLNVDTAICIKNLADSYREQKKYIVAEPLFKRALDFYERYRPKHPDTMNILNALEMLYQRQEKYAEAEVLLKHALEIHEQHFGQQHLMTAYILHKLAHLYKAQEKYAKAEPVYQRALGIWKQQLGSEHPLVAASLYDLADLYKCHGKYEQAKPFYQHALAIYEQSLGPQHPNTQQVRQKYAKLLRAMGRDYEAKQLEEKQ